MGVRRVAPLRPQAVRTQGHGPEGEGRAGVPPAVEVEVRLGRRKGEDLLREGYRDNGPTVKCARSTIRGRAPGGTRLNPKQGSGRRSYRYSILVSRRQRKNP